MRLSLILMGALLAIPAFSGGPDYVKEGRAIRQRIAAYSEAARSGDAKAAAALRTEQFDAIGAGGAAASGQPQFQQIRFLRPDLALVDGSLGNRSHTWVLEKRNGIWLLAASR